MDAAFGQLLEMVSCTLGKVLLHSCRLVLFGREFTASRRAIWLSGNLVNRNIGLNTVLIAGFLSKYSVWGLSPEGVIYRRLGISTQNLRGTSWEKVPGMFAHITGILLLGNTAF